MRKGAVLIAAIAILTASAALAAEKQVTIRWYGHAFVLVTSPQGVRVAMDPFGDIGYPMPDVAAEVVTVSHDHSDHNNASLVKGSPKILRGLGMGGKHWTVVNHREKDVRVRALPAYHDKEEGKKRDEKAFLDGKPRVRQVGNQVSVSKENLPKQTEIWVMSYR